MPRIEFDGEGVPIPSLALPPVGSDDSIAPTVLTFTENADFSVADYRTLGFTHFEAWCVGAAGGRGGNATNQVVYIKKQEMRPVPANVWADYLEEVTIDDYMRQRNDYFNGWQGPPVYNQVYTPSMWGYSIVANGLPAGWTGTAAQAAEYRNPNHLLRFTIYKETLLFPTDLGLGGGGGGGGLHHSSGILTDLPDLVPVVVGKTGVDAGYGQTHQNGLWTPEMTEDFDYIWFANPGAEPDAYIRRKHEIINARTLYTNSYPPPKSVYGNPQPGGDGGASSFAGAVCQASGGKGGSPGMVWDGTKFVLNGNGGSGGLGGRALAGGGAAGSIAEGVNGADGAWDPEIGIGAGGGGGKGGRAPTVTGDPRFGPTITTRHDATAGGQGSFSYADTSVYGQRQFRQVWIYSRPISKLPYDGTYTMAPTTTDSSLVPGGGGGARPITNLKVGSRAPGYSPDGIVVIRLVKIT